MATVKVNVLFKLWFIVFMSRTFVYMRSLPRIGYIMPYMHISFNSHIQSRSMKFSVMTKNQL